MVTAKIDIEKQIEYYMKLPYTMTVKHRPEQVVIMLPAILNFLI